MTMFGTSARYNGLKGSAIEFTLPNKIAARLLAHFGPLIVDSARKAAILGHDEEMLGLGKVSFEFGWVGCDAIDRSIFHEQAGPWPALPTLSLPSALTVNPPSALPMAFAKARRSSICAMVQ